MDFYFRAERFAIVAWLPDVPDEVFVEDLIVIIGGIGEPEDD